VRIERVLTDLGNKLLEWQSTAGLACWGDCKTQADLDAHDYLSEHLNKFMPIPVLSEEAPWPSDIPDKYWLIDPIDGTRSYLDGYEGWVTQVALMNRGWPMAAWVYAPATDEMWTATEGCGAKRNEIRIHTSDDGSAIDNTPEPSEDVSKAMKALGLTDYDTSGSIGLKLCRVAEGTASLFFKDVGVKTWDLAPGCLILKEAGGHMTTRDGSMIWYGGGPRVSGLVACSSLALHTRFRTWEGRG